MSRVIKFNAWDMFESKMIYWNDMIRTQSDEVYWLPEILLNSVRYVPLQYTDMSDKNGVEIYEGDLLEGFEFPVEFSLGQFGARIVYDQIFIPLADMNPDEILVIGNKFQTKTQ